MPVKNNNLSQRARTFAQKITALEDAKKQMSKQDLLSTQDTKAVHKAITRDIKGLKSRLDAFQKQVDKAYYGTNGNPADMKPVLESTTLWDYPKQSYGTTKKGNSKFQGVTPAFIIYNMLHRYTNPGDLVIDPMCGSGTTIDVCMEESREVIGFDLSPTRDDIKQNDARSLPLRDNSVDMAFVDSPYGDNVSYSDNPDDIGKISAEDDEFYEALGKVANELHRILKPDKVVGWLIGDQWVKRKFTPVGFCIYQMLENTGFVPIDLICIARRNQSSNTGVWHYRAVKHNFYLRGFKHLIIMRKPGEGKAANNGKINRPAWKKYK